MDQIVIYGAGASFAADLVETLRRLDHTIAAAVLTGTPEWSLSGISCVIHEDEAGSELCALPVVVCDLVPGLRKKRIARARELGFRQFPTLVDPTAIVPPSVRLGRGTYINAGAVLGAEVMLDDHAWINRAASIGHHTVIGEYGTIGPSAAVASHCTIDAGAFFGLNASTTVGRKIGANSVVGAGAVVIEDVPDNTLVVGNPARVAKQGIAGYGKSSV